MLYSGAREAGAWKAKLEIASSQFRASLHAAIDARLWLISIVTSATGTGMAVANMGAAQAAIYAARRNDQRVHDLYLYEFIRQPDFPFHFTLKVILVSAEFPARSVATTRNECVPTFACQNKP
jgi:hypothetical protein